MPEFRKIGADVFRDVAVFYQKFCFLGNFRDNFEKPIFTSFRFVSTAIRTVANAHQILSSKNKSHQSSGLNISKKLIPKFVEHLITFEKNLSSSEFKLSKMILCYLKNRETSNKL